MFGYDIWKRAQGWLQQKVKEKYLVTKNDEGLGDLISLTKVLFFLSPLCFKMGIGLLVVKITFPFTY